MLFETKSDWIIMITVVFVILLFAEKFSSVDKIEIVMNYSSGSVQHIYPR